jgi:uncharacterized DUF497 family protein
MDRLKFEWDDAKAEINVKKHGVTFEEAATVFDDADAILFDDPDHSQDEDRFILLGMSLIAHVLIVCHCYRNEDQSIRIISARKATKKEAEQYTSYGKEW